MRLDLASLAVFVRVAELGSFTEAARQLGMPKARASAHVQRLEAELGTLLLQRSTRVLRLTPEGERLIERAPPLLAEAEEIEAMFGPDRVLRGRVRVELPVVVALEFVVPRLPDLLARHPALQVEICASDRIAPAMREGFDLVLRIGPVHEPGLVGRRLGTSEIGNYASAGYLARYGTPRAVEDLDSHYVVHYAADSSPNFEYLDGDAYREHPMRSQVTVDNFEVYEAACAAGLGIAQLPRAGRRADLVEILPTLRARPVPVTLLHTHGRSAPRRVQVVRDWLVEILAPIAAPGP